jgi:hypothetical protein
VSDDEYLLPDPSGFWDLLTVRIIKDVGKKPKFPHYPPGFLKASEQYRDLKRLFRSEHWESLRTWREYAKRNPESAPTDLLLPSSHDDRENIEYFKDLILAAVFYGEKDVLQAVFDIVTLPKPPDPDMHGIRAAIAAFEDLFKGDSEDDWPDKKEVRELATDILKKAGKPIPVHRQWPRIFDKSGLKALRTSKRKSKRVATT